MQIKCQLRNSIAVSVTAALKVKQRSHVRGGASRFEELISFQTPPSKYLADYASIFRTIRAAAKCRRHRLRSRSTNESTVEGLSGSRFSLGVLYSWQVAQSATSARRYAMAVRICLQPQCAPRRLHEVRLRFSNRFANKCIWVIARPITDVCPSKYYPVRSLSWFAAALK